jgi:hypothetical protein
LFAACLTDFFGKGKGLFLLARSCGTMSFYFLKVVRFAEKIYNLEGIWPDPRVKGSTAPFDLLSLHDQIRNENHAPSNQDPLGRISWSFSVRSNLPEKDTLHVFDPETGCTVEPPIEFSGRLCLQGEDGYVDLRLESGKVVQTIDESVLLAVNSTRVRFPDGDFEKLNQVHRDLISKVDLSPSEAADLEIIEKFKSQENLYSEFWQLPNT